MTHIEKTVFISYRRKDISWALAVYQYLTGQKYDVFFDYTSLHSGDFEKVILSNIRARAHFVLILTPTALDRCSESGDWLRREIETAVDEKRNLIPLFFDGFSFSAPGIAGKLTGKLAALNRYNGLEVPPGYFIEAMQRLKNRYLNIPTNSVIHPVTTEIRKVVKETQLAADKAVEEQKADLEQITRSDLEKVPDQKTIIFSSSEDKDAGTRKNVKYWSYGIGVFLVIALGFAFLRQFPQGNEQPATATLSSLGTPTWESATATIPPTSTQENITSTPMITPAPLMELKIGSTTKSPVDDMVQVYVPAGKFEMGARNGGDIDEKPVHTVTLDAFWIDQTEITNAMYAKCVAAGGCAAPSPTSSHSRDDYYEKSPSQYDHFPVINVTWNDAKAYCAWASRRLPTEAEWEKAASWDERKAQKNTYPGGNKMDGSIANYWVSDGIPKGDTTAVGSYPDGASSYGALDMAGNVWEWVNDWYRLNYYEVSPTINPQGPELADLRVFRGGSWNSGRHDVRSANRAMANPASAQDFLGFRCAFQAAP